MTWAIHLVGNGFDGIAQATPPIDISDWLERDGLACNEWMPKLSGYRCVHVGRSGVTASVVVLDGKRFEVSQRFDRTTGGLSLAIDFAGLRLPERFA